METGYKYNYWGFIWKNLDFITDSFMSSVLGHSFEKLTLLQLKSDLIFNLFFSFYLCCISQIKSIQILYTL